MKTCHQCHETFPDGLTCPNCRAFVPDPFLDDESETDASDASGAPAGPAWATTAPVAPPPGPSWAVAAPIEATAENTTTEPVGPSWAVPEPAAAPAPAPAPASSPAPGPGSGAPHTPGTDLEPVAFPAWARPADESAPPPPAAPPAGRPPTDDPPAAGFDHQALFRSSGPVGPIVAPPTSPSSSPLTPATIAIGLAAVVVVLVLGVVVLHPGGKATAAVAPDIAGTCFVYNADRAQIDTTVACDQSHDGTVLGYATDQSRCPDGTDAILTTQADTVGRNGVLCIREK